MAHGDPLPPHVLIFPLPLQGPVNNMFKLAELLCLAGVNITFLVTDHIHRRLSRYANIHSRFRRYPGFKIATIADGLPADHPRDGNQFIEIFDSLKSPETKAVLRDVLCGDGGKQGPLTCVIADGILGFAFDVANDVGIPVISTRTVSPACLWIFFCLPKLIQSQEIPFPGNDLDELIKNVPGTETFLRRRDLPGFCRSGDISDPNVKLYETEGQINSRARGLILNTFEELDGSILSQIRTLCPNLYPIGPLHAHLKTKLLAGETAATASPPASSSLWQEDRSCIGWLDNQPLRSVIYVSFGSIATLTKEQLMEFWYGLVNSGQKFLWVIRRDSVAGKDWKSQAPTELTQGTQERGYIVGWAPQEEVLAHLAVGGFLTHNGWNSTLESVYEGVPMICWPYFLDQQVNSRFVEAVYRLGLDMKDTCDRVTIERIVRELMEMRKDEFLQEAKKMGELAKRSILEGGSSYTSFERLVSDIKTWSSRSLRCDN
ncbi:PREDICTED: 7-deoxyloganetic acid glucosyltransferase-like [Ipomoea nil]|uniref:7-deoxyloganetic acid glucosyltransferase-like n=1 Tax=Ipomoea nil TaxID=35883 RepID=UPI000900C3D0|nr:PREDICTED: 7-deoxyloganetic acid glucosyltransferase-like [Ipomoea nil]